MISQINGNQLLGLTENVDGVNFETFESHSSRGLCYTINLKALYIDSVTKFAAGTAFKYVKIDANTIVD